MAQNTSASPAARAWHARAPILVWGGGAIGGCVAAFLARAGVPVKMVDIVAEHVQASRTSGLRIEGPVAQFSQRLDAATPAELSGQYDCILLSVKAQHTDDAVAQLLPHLSDTGVLVSLQNGLSERLIARRIGEQRTIAGFVNFAADYLEPGRIGFGNRGALKLGEMRPGLTPRVESLAELLRAFDTDTVAVPDVWRFKWGKLAYGSLLFATALANETMSESLADPQHRSLFVALAREVIGVATLAGVQPVGFDGFEPSAFRAGASDAEAAESLARMADHYRHSTKQRSGVWRDLAVRKRKTEIDSQIAEIVRVAQAQGAGAPITEILIRLVHEIEDGSRAIDRSNLLEFAAAVRGLVSTA
ncbi:MAG TPA: 2-dehydropantoate 2-reductase [Ramlibacter sp.]|nr:2-dehydropantoate 2-reductase [Ramlibacter sp.]